MVKVLLSEIVKEFMDEQERLSPQQLPRFVRIAKRGLDELHYDIAGEPYTKKLKVDTKNNTAPLPSNFVKEAGVYYKDHLGQYQILSRNENLYKPTDDCGVIEKAHGSTNVFPVGYASSYITKNNQFAGGAYGYGGRSTYGEYTIDYNTGLVFISSDFDKEDIYLMYIGTPEETNGDFAVHPYLKEPIKKYLYWKIIDFKDSAPAGEKARRFDDYVNAKLWAANQLNSINKDEQRDNNLKNFTLAPKI